MMDEFNPACLMRDAESQGSDPASQPPAIH
jgi:hypothetical protein